MKKSLIFILLSYFILQLEKLSAQPASLLNQGYKLVYVDEFNNGVIAPWTADNEVEHGEENCESQVYLSPNVTESEGWLKITARKENYTCTPQNQTVQRTFKYTSGQVVSPMNLTYGYFEIKCEMPAFTGSWPAFWLLKGSQGNAYQEIDIFEACGAQPNAIKSGTYQELIKTCIDGKTKYIADTDGIPDNHKVGTMLKNDGWIKIPEIPTPPIFPAPAFFNNITKTNVYGVEWTPKHIKWFINGIETFTEVNGNLFDPEHIILNLALDSGCFCNKNCGKNCIEDTKLPAIYKIDYVRIWQKENQNIYIKGNENMCRGTTKTFFAPYYADATYQWTCTGGLTINSTTHGWGNWPVNCPYFKDGWDGVNVTATQAGNQVLTLTITFSGGATETIAYNVLVSDDIPAMPTSVTFKQNDDGCYYKGIIQANSGTLFVMIKSGVKTEFSGYEIPSNFRKGQTKFSIYAKNDCGLSAPLNINEVLDELPNCLKWQLKISPNPGNTYVNVDNRKEQ